MVRCSGEALRFASAELKADKEIVQTAVTIDPASLHFASKSLQHDLDLVELGMSKDPSIFRIAGKANRGIPSLAKQAVDADPGNIRYVHPDLLKSKEFMTRCVQRCASHLAHAHCLLETKIYLEALKQDGLVLEFLGEKKLARCGKPPKGRDRDPWYCLDPLCDEFEYVRTAVGQNGMALAFASERLRGCVQLASEAIRNDERAMKFVKSKEVVLELLQERPLALKHALWEFHDDVEVVAKAYASDCKSMIYAGTQAALGMIRLHGPEVLKHMKPSIQQNEEVLELIANLTQGESDWEKTEQKFDQI